MRTIRSRINNKCNANQLGLLIFGGLCLMTIGFLAVSQGAVSKQTKVVTGLLPGAVQISGKLSQNKIVQGGEDKIYLDITIKSPSVDKQVSRQGATDVVIVLDRSGSMSGAKKMTYAKAAIHDVLSRLNANDRFAFVSFANHAIVHSPLVAVDTSQREQINRLVDSIYPSGGTNMGSGLDSAMQLMRENHSEHNRKVLLLSDGHANQGITRPESLAQLASRLTQFGAVVSSIGMGLDFNETLMTNIADHGMGQYAFLEDLSGLGHILTDDLQETRNIYASSSSMDIKLSDGVQLIDAGGYPITKVDAATVRIATGQLLANSVKHFVMTLQVSADHPGNYALGEFDLNYKAKGQQYQLGMDQMALQLAIVEPECRQEAISSINNEVYKQSWLKNNLGRMQQKLSKWVREGKKDKAEQAITQYRDAIKAAEDESNMPLVSTEMDDRLNAMQAEVEEVFTGSRSDQDVKRKRAAKSIQYGAIKEQRTSQ